MAPRLDAMAPMQLNKPSFTIVVSEKGGAERREVFSAFELGIGRVQGNDLTLVKGNVSKQHARISYRDGLFVVTDLNSTNGTYVNRRKIQEPTKISEGDRVYVGDFILRIEGVEHPALPEGQSNQPEGAPDPNDAKAVADSTTSKSKSSAIDGPGRAVLYPDLPGPPKIPTHGAAVSAWTENSPGRVSLASEDLQSIVNPGATAATLAPGERDVNGLLAMLVEAVVEVVGERWAGGNSDVEHHNTVDRVIDDQLQRILQLGNFPPTVQLDRLRTLARTEVLGLGPIGKLLEDASITEILVPRFDQVMVRRNGNLEPHEQGLSSRRSLRRIILRLCTKSGQPVAADEAMVERALPNGGILWAVLPPIALGQPALILHKPREAPANLQGLVRAGVISRAMSVFLQQAVAAKSRILVVGPRESDIAAVAGALLGSVTEGPVALVEGRTDL
ncbi:MAG TPA: FHA domain-containing protein, partial [Polyangiaceae bacterium]